MGRLLLVGLLVAGSFAASSPVLARGGGHSGGGGHFHYSAPVYRTPVMRSAPVYHPTQVHTYARQQYVQPRYSIQPRGAQVIHAGPTISRPAFAPHNPIYANPVRRAPDRFVRLHGSVIGLPALAGLLAPVILDLPGISEVIVPQETYVTVYPMLVSENEAERERAFSIIKDQAEQNPDSHVIVVESSASEDPCPDCKDAMEVLHTCKPVGRCDLTERLVNSPKNPDYLVPERAANQRGSIH